MAAIAGMGLSLMGFWPHLLSWAHAESVFCVDETVLAWKWKDLILFLCQFTKLNNVGHGRGLIGAIVLGIRQIEVVFLVVLEEDLREICLSVGKSEFSS